MYRLPQAGPRQRAVAGPVVQRGVLPLCLSARHGGVFPLLPPPPICTALVRLACSGFVLLAPRDDQCHPERGCRGCDAEGLGQGRQV